MRQAHLWSTVLLVVCCVGCGSGYEVNAYTPTTAFVEDLKAKAEQLAKSELARFNEIELASKEELRFEKLPTPFPGQESYYFKEYRDYTACRVLDVRRTDSYLFPIVVTFAFEYRLMATAKSGDRKADSPQRAQAETEFKLVREDRATIDYRCTSAGDVADPLPGLLPRDSVLNVSWNKFLEPGETPVSPVKEPPSRGAAPASPLGLTSQTPTAPQPMAPTVVTPLSRP